MARPKTYEDGRIETKVRFEPDLHARLKAEAEARLVSMNLLVERAVEHYLAALVPVDDVAPRLKGPGEIAHPEPPGTRTRPRLKG